MARTNQERLDRLQARLTSARENVAKYQRFAKEGATSCQVWADHFEGVALSLEQKIYELKLEMQAAPVAAQAPEQSMLDRALGVLKRSKYEAAAVSGTLIAVNDPVMCSRGSHKWIEFNRVTLEVTTDLNSVYNFISQRS